MAATTPRRPRWGFKTSLFQLGQPAFWLFGLLLLGGAYYTMLEQALLQALSGGGWGFAWFLALLFAVPMAVLVYLLDLYEREPISLVVAALLWGGVIAIAVASIANSGWLAATLQLGGPTFVQEWGAAIVAPPVEETVKGIGVIVIYLIARDEIDDLMDGFVYGALIGLAFAATENVFYFLANFAPDPAFEGNTIGAIFQGFFLRVVASGIYGHVLWTGLFGIAVAYVVTRRGDVSRGRRVGVAAGLVALAILGHFVWNSPLLDFLPILPLDDAGEYAQTLFAAAVKGIPLLAVVVLMVVLARRRERRWLRSALETEVGLDGLTAEELATLESRAARKRRRREVATRGGRTAVAAQKRLERAQINLAMIRSRVEEDDHPDLVAQRRFCADLRARLLAAMSSSASG